MSLFRSEDMNLCKLIVTKDNAFEVIEALGMIDEVFIVNLNPDEQPQKLTYSREVSKCNEIVSKIDFIMSECVKYSVNINKVKTFKEFVQMKEFLQKSLKLSKLTILDYLNKEIKSKNDFLKEQTERIENMCQDYDDLIEYHKVIEATHKMLECDQFKGMRSRLDSMSEIDFSGKERKSIDHEEAKHLIASSFISDNSIEIHEDSEINVGRVVGTCHNKDLLRLKRLIFRATRGNALIINRNEENMHEFKNKSVPKSIFIIVFQEGKELRHKIETIATNFSKNLYVIPSKNVNTKLDKIQGRINQTKQLIKLTISNLNKYLENLNADCKLDLYRKICLYNEEIFMKLNFLHIKNNLFEGYFWSRWNHLKIQELILDEEEEFNTLRNISPEEAINSMRKAAIEETHIVSGHMGDIPPPSYFKLNEFTAPFQQIISTYGVPKYKEVNPAYFSIVTFPFLFGIMFGDIGHGFFLFCFGAFLCSNSSRIEKYDLLKSFLPIRYLIVLMGFFSFFCGFIYNDFLSIPFELSPTCYQRGNSGKYILKDDCVYGFGIDHTWYKAGNHLDFMNSMKMKLSVIIGVSHMTLGIIMKAVNSKYFHKTMDFIFEFIPQLVLLLVTFGYMNMLIVIKWCTYYEDTSRAPSIVATMIDMMLGYGAVNQTPLIYSKEAQRILSVLIIISIVISVPMMLLAKPIIITQQIHKKNSSKESGLIELGVCNFKKRKLSDPPINDECKSDSDDENGSLIKKKTDLKRRFQSNDEEDRREAVYNPADDPYSIKDEEKKDEAREKLIKITKQYKESNHHNIEEIWIHQLIETVEFVLGTVSNTASYLRLWALSLAHSQLAAVFYDKLLRDEIEQRRWFMASLIIPFFLAAHFFILMCMDSMECFLHTLRLHWVEFQNKFFKGTGYRFITFSLTERIGFKQGEETN